MMPFHKPRTPVFPPLFLMMALVLSGCMTTPPSTMLKMSRLSPLEADPSAIRLAVQLPEALAVRDGDVRLRISFDGGTAETSLVEEYAALVTAQPPAAPGIPVTPQSGTYVVVAALSEDDAQSLASVQRRIRDWRAAGIDGKGSLSVSASACANGTVPDGPLYITTFIQTAPEEPFMTLSRRTDLSKLAARAPSAEIVLCGDPAAT